MKRVLRITSLTIICVLLISMLASCGNRPFGAYESKAELLGQSVSTTYDFGFNTVEVTVKTTILGQVETTTSSAKYEIHKTYDGLEITFIEEVEGEEKASTFTYEIGEDFIKIGGVQYNKVQK